ncbi:MAG: SPOR domain-containing protein [Pseudomonadales bacterium]|nr:SPOR domain-containing protein [Pseudomonadales bacterium]
MASDYAKQHKPRAKKKSRKQSQPSGVQWGTFGTGMIVGILCTLAAAFLPAQIPGSNPAPPSISGENTNTNNLTQRADNKTNLTPEFEFFHRLPVDEVPIQKGTYEALRPEQEEHSSEYLLQAVSFRNPDDASRVRAKLLLLGLNAHTERTSINGSAWYRVLVGPFSNRTALNRAQTKLREENLNPLPIKRQLSG